MDKLTQTDKLKMIYDYLANNHNEDADVGSVLEDIEKSVKNLAAEELKAQTYQEFLKTFIGKCFYFNQYGALYICKVLDEEKGVILLTYHTTPETALTFKNVPFNSLKYLLFKDDGYNFKDNVKEIEYEKFNELYKFVYTSDVNWVNLLNKILLNDLTNG